MARLRFVQETFTKWPSRLSRTWDSVRDLTSSASRTIGTSARPPRLQRSSLPERRTARSRSQTQRPDRVGLGYVRVRHGVRGRLVLLLRTFLVIFPKYKTAGLIQSRGKGL